MDNFDSSYKAIVCRINTRPHPNADRIQLGTCMGNQVIVGLDVRDGEMGVFFPTDGQLSPEFLQHNDLVRRTDPDTGKRVGGFFAENGRVRSQKFRGEMSDGFWCPLSLFGYTGYTDWKVGNTFTGLNGYAICRKYETPATKAARKNKQRGVNTVRETKMFRMMENITQFRNGIYLIPFGSTITITEKVHGTSHRVGYVLQPKKQTWYNRLFRHPVQTEWVYLSGTRRVVLGAIGQNENAFTANMDFRRASLQPFLNNLHPGEVVYYEIVGYEETGAPIMSSQDNLKLSDKRIVKRYGPKMTYSYGCQERTCDVYVYRIVHMSPDGTEIELSWPQVCRRCKELGVKHVPQLTKTLTFVDSSVFVDPNSFGMLTNMPLLEVTVDTLVDGPSVITSDHIREGVVVRVDTPNGETYRLKHKSFVFGVLEGYLKDQDDYVDREEAA